jgi:type IV secretory pathway TraG/TraD family ATPase VirD4
MLMGRKRPNPPVLLAIDEFPSLGRLDGIENVAPTMRSFGVRFWAIAQDISQLKDVYPGCWSGFIGNAEAVQFMGVTHAETVDFISERLGKHVVERMQQGGRMEQRERPLLEPEQVGRLLWPELRNQIVWRGSRRAMKLKVAPYYEYLPRWYWTPDPRR